MLVLQVLIEYKSNTLDRPFSYLYFGNKKVEKGFRVLVRFHDEREIVGYVLSVQNVNKTQEQLEEEMGFSLDTIIDVLDVAPLLNDELLQLVDRISEYYLSSKILVLQKMLPKSLAPKKSAFKGPKIQYEEFFLNQYVHREPDGKMFAFLKNQKLDFLQFPDSRFFPSLSTAY